MKRSFAFASLLILFLATVVMAQQGRRGSARERWDSDKVVTLKGEITEVNMPVAKFKSEGKEYSVHLGPIWFWNQKDYELKKGEAELRGELEKANDSLHFYPYTVTQGSAKFELADDDGVPHWSARAGAGRGGMMGRGQHHGQGRGCCGRCCE